jgi:hypothetical protein
MAFRFDKSFTDFTYGNMWAMPTENGWSIRGNANSIEVKKGDKLYVTPTETAHPNSLILDVEKIEGDTIYFGSGGYSLKAASFVGILKE